MPGGQSPGRPACGAVALALRTGFVTMPETDWTEHMLRLAFLALILPAPLAAQSVSCPGGGGHIAPQALCAAVSSALGARAAGVTLDVLRNEPQILTARLTWAQGAGPVVEVSTNDRPLDARAANRLAQGLVAVTDLP